MVARRRDGQDAAARRPGGRGGFRRRLVVTFVGVVVLTSAVLGASAYTFTAISLREQVRQEAIERADFNVAVLAPQRLSDRPDLTEIQASNIEESFRLRGSRHTVVDFGNGQPYESSLTVSGALGRLSDEVKAFVG